MRTVIIRMITMRMIVVKTIMAMVRAYWNGEFFLVASRSSCCDGGERQSLSSTSNPIATARETGRSATMVGDEASVESQSGGLSAVRQL